MLHMLLRVFRRENGCHHELYRRPFAIALLLSISLYVRERLMEERERGKVYNVPTGLTHQHIRRD